MNRTPQDGPARKNRGDSDVIEWEDYPRILRGEYRAYCKWGKKYRDPGFRRWLCLLRWNVLSDDLARVIATVPQWFPLGCREKPHASRRGKYLPEWIRANGGPPARHDRLSPSVFVRRMARVEIGDTEGPAPYSVVRRIIEWETGPPCHSVSKSTSQGRPTSSSLGSEAFESCLSGLSETKSGEGVWGNPKGVSPLAPGEDSAFGAIERDNASALAGVEGEYTPAHTQGAGAPETTDPPKAHETGSARQDQLAPRKQGLESTAVSVTATRF
jgi:hypothetical protein